MQQISSDEIVAVDFETYYDSEYGLTTMSTWNYIHDPRFDAYLVAFYGNGIKFTGHPSKADWHLLDGKTVVMHNASFDEMVMERLMELGVIPADVCPKQVLCTADLAAYLGCKRDLKTATKELLGEEADKTVRSNMKGKHYADAVQAGMEDALLAYGGDDAIHCFKLAEKYLDKWPESERQLSNLNRKAGAKGIAIDVPLVDEGLKTLKAKLAHVMEVLPWIEEGKPPLSPHAIRAQGRADGIPVPASLAKDDPLVLAWQEKYGEQFPWVKATGEYRSINTLLKRVESVKQGIRADGTMPYQCKYFGASTGRMSGGGDSGGKFNVQNMPQHDMFGVDLRHLLIARPGKTYVISDFSQIEARMLLWRVGDKEFIDLINTEGNIYVAYAKKAQGKIIEKGTPEYKLAKCQCLTPETLVLTNRGYIPIVQVRTTDLVWDGESWVTHRGVIKSGERNIDEIIYSNGGGYTDDHRIFTGPQTTERAGTLLTGKGSGELPWWNPPGSGWADLRQLAGAVGRALLCTLRTLRKVSVQRLRARVCRARSKSAAG